MSTVTLSGVKNQLKTIGCKLKSQLDGSWAICEPRGSRVIVPTLEAVEQYYLSKISQNTAPEKAAATQPNIPPVIVSVAQSPVLSGSFQPAVSVKPVAPVVDPQIAEQQKIAISAVNNFIRSMKEKRLARGLNLLHSEIKPSLLKHGCPEALMDKAYSYAEAKLYKDCLDKVLVKRSFQNHAQKSDVMYFDSKYAHLFAEHS